MPARQAPSPEVKWEDGTWFVTLPVDDGKVVEASWKPPVTYVVRIREVGAERFSFGFETPITSFTFVDLKPDTEYEVRGSAGPRHPLLPQASRRSKGRTVFRQSDS